MEGRTTPHLWPLGLRIGVSALCGAVWALLWIGLADLGLAPIVFLTGGLILLSPVFATLARTPQELPLLLAVGYAASLVSSGLLYAAFLGTPVPPPETQRGILRNASLAWIPFTLVSVILGLAIQWTRKRRAAGAR